MVATLKYGIGQEVKVPVSSDRLAGLKADTVRGGLQRLLEGVIEDSNPAALSIRQATADPRSVIEMKTESGYVPLERGASFQGLVADREDLEILISRPHAGG